MSDMSEEGSGSPTRTKSQASLQPVEEVRGCRFHVPCGLIED